MSRFSKFLILIGLALATPLKAEDQPIDLRAVGLLVQAGTGGCTATLVEPDLILTAAHCVMGRDNSGAYIPPEKYVFSPSTLSGGPGSGYRGVAVAVHPVFLILPAGAKKKLRRDIALIRLATPVPPEHATPLPISAPDLFPERGFVVSYRGQTGGPLRQRACPVISEEDQFLVLGCQVVGGESGSPLIVVQDGVATVYAVVSSRFRMKQQPVGLASVAGHSYDGMLTAMKNGQGR